MFCVRILSRPPPSHQESSALLTGKVEGPVTPPYSVPTCGIVSVGPLLRALEAPKTTPPALQAWPHLAHPVASDMFSPRRPGTLGGAPGFFQRVSSTSSVLHH